MVHKELRQFAYGLLLEEIRLSISNREGPAELQILGLQEIKMDLQNANFPEDIKNSPDMIWIMKRIKEIEDTHSLSLTRLQGAKNKGTKLANIRQVRKPLQKNLPPPTCFHLHQYLFPPH